MSNRAVYRVDLTGTFHLRGALRRDGQSAIEGRLIDISGRGAAIVFWSRIDPHLELGDHIELVFVAPSGNSVAAESRVSAKSTEGDGYTRYGFHFVDPEDVDARVPALMRAMFNRRCSPRVRPASPIPVELDVPGLGPLESEIVDISVSGIGFDVPFSEAHRFARGERVELTVTLPTSPVPIHAQVVVHGHRLAGANVRIGAELSLASNPDREQIEDVIQDFVASREVDSHFAR